MWQNSRGLCMDCLCVLMNSRMLNPGELSLDVLPLKRRCSSICSWQTNTEAGAASTHPSSQATRQTSLSQQVKPLHTHQHVGNMPLH